MKKFHRSKKHFQMLTLSVGAGFVAGAFAQFWGIGVAVGTIMALMTLWHYLFEYNRWVNYKIQVHGKSPEIARQEATRFAFYRRRYHMSVYDFTTDPGCSAAEGNIYYREPPPGPQI